MKHNTRVLYHIIISTSKYIEKHTGNVICTCMNTLFLGAISGFTAIELINHLSEEALVIYMAIGMLVGLVCMHANRKTKGGTLLISWLCGFSWPLSLFFICVLYSIRTISNKTGKSKKGLFKW